MTIDNNPSAEYVAPTFPNGTLNMNNLETCMYFPRVGDPTKVGRLFIRFADGDTATINFVPAHTRENAVGQLSPRQIRAGAEQIIVITTVDYPDAWHARLTKDGADRIVGSNDSLTSLEAALEWVQMEAERPMHHLALQEAMNRFEVWKEHAVHAVAAGHTPVIDHAHSAGFGATWVL